MRRKLGDRRNRPRYDIVGDLWGTLETVLQLPLKNVGPGGVLFESHVALPAESVHSLVFSCDGRETASQVRVRHVIPVEAANGERTYLIGVEFLSRHPVLVSQIDRWMTASGVDSTAAGA